MANLSLGLLALGWWVYSYVMQEGDKARNWRSRWRRMWMGDCMDGLSVPLDFLFASLVYWRTDSFGKRTRNDAFFERDFCYCALVSGSVASRFLLPAGYCFRFTLLVAYLSEMNSADNPR